MLLANQSCPLPKARRPAHNRFPHGSRNRYSVAGTIQKVSWQRCRCFYAKRDQLAQAAGDLVAEAEDLDAKLNAGGINPSGDALFKAFAAKPFQRGHW